MDEAQKRAWTALELGPVWHLRAVRGQEARAVPEGAASGPAGASAPAGRADGTVPEAQGAWHEHAPTLPTIAADAARPVESDRELQAVESTAVPVPQSGQGLAAETTPALDVSPVASMGWVELREAVAACRACALCETRTRTVFGVGATQARWMIVGEAPGAEEDARGEPFVGQAGKLLDSMLGSLGLGRERDVFIANVLKCRPPGNRNPEPAEVARCEPFLARQAELLEPEVIIAMGRFAAQSLLRTDASIASLRGKVHSYRVGERSVPLVVTYHPAYLLRSLAEKSKAWADLCLARSCVTGPG